MENSIKKIIQKFLKQNIQENFPDAFFGSSEVIVSETRGEQFGDYTTNVAMVLAGKLKKIPTEIAEKITQVLDGKIDGIGKIEIVKPGYINFHLSEKYLQNKIVEINAEKNDFGKSNIGSGKKINNEFISANPTGPLHLGNGRGGFCGDVLANVLKKCGYSVTREYYVNDAGEQITKLGHSVLKDGEAVYTGDYIDELNKQLGHLNDPKRIGEKASEIILKEMIGGIVSEKMKIHFDSWVSEKSLYDNGYVDKAIDRLKNKNLTEEKEGALWLKTTQFGDDKDRVLVKSDGQKTYFASDCGYILYKIERGFDRIIEIWGADHHGYIRRFKAAARALGFSGELKFIIVQMVRLMKDGKEVRMSKRAGNVVYIDELIEKVGHDVARFMFLSYSPETHMNFDLGVAEEKSEKNPVFYVQYAYARISSILRKAQEVGIEIQSGEINNLTLLVNEKELSLIRELDHFPGLVEEIAESLEVHKLSHYAIRLADKFHSFYNDCRVIEESNPELTRARLLLVNAVRIVLAENLRLIGVSAPDKM